jgi:catechol 2,3-dioxygenase-like lactoylglutathione lyase family enzyme
MGEPTGRIKGLGEIALRVADLDAMQRFYQEVLGLELLRRFDHAAFFRIADGFGGHTQVLALFDRPGQAGYGGLDPERTTVDHLAFEIDLADYEGEKARLEGLGVRVTTAEHAWVRWRSLAFGLIDLVFGILFVVAYVRTAGSPVASR